MNFKTVIGDWWQAVREILSSRANHSFVLSAPRELRRACPERKQRLRWFSLPYDLKPITYALLFIFTLFPVTLAHAQSESASLSGTIVDQKGGLVPDAQVAVVN